MVEETKKYTQIIRNTLNLGSIVLGIILSIVQLIETDALYLQIIFGSIAGILGVFLISYFLYYIINFIESWFKERKIKKSYKESLNEMGRFDLLKPEGEKIIKLLPKGLYPYLTEPEFLNDFYVGLPISFYPLAMVDGEFISMDSETKMYLCWIKDVKVLGFHIIGSKNMREHAMPEEINNDISKLSLSEKMQWEIILKNLRDNGWTSLTLISISNYIDKAFLKYALYKEISNDEQDQDTKTNKDSLLLIYSIKEITKEESEKILNLALERTGLIDL